MNKIEDPSATLKQNRDNFLVDKIIPVLCAVGALGGLAYYGYQESKDEKDWITIGVLGTLFTFSTFSFARTFQYSSQQSLPKTSQIVENNSTEMERIAQKVKSMMSKDSSEVDSCFSISFESTMSQLMAIEQNLIFLRKQNKQLVEKLEEKDADIQSYQSSVEYLENEIENLNEYCHTTKQYQDNINRFSESLRSLELSIGKRDLQVFVR